MTISKQYRVFLFNMLIRRDCSVYSGVRFFQLFIIRLKENYGEYPGKTNDALAGALLFSESSLILLKVNYPYTGMISGKYCSYFFFHQDTKRSFTVNY